MLSGAATNNQYLQASPPYLAYPGNRASLRDRDSEKLIARLAQKTAAENRARLDLRLSFIDHLLALIQASMVSFRSFFRRRSSICLGLGNSLTDFSIGDNF